MIDSPDRVEQKADQEGETNVSARSGSSWLQRHAPRIATLLGAASAAATLAQGMTPSANARMMENPEGVSQSDQMTNVTTESNVELQGNNLVLKPTTTTVESTAQSPTPADKISVATISSESGPSQTENQLFIKPDSTLRTIPGKTTLEDLLKRPGIKQRMEDSKNGTIILSYTNFRDGKAPTDKVVIDAKTNLVIEEVMNAAQPEGDSLAYPTSLDSALKVTNATVINRYPGGPGTEVVVTSEFTAITKGGQITDFTTYANVQDLINHDLKDSSDPFVKGATNGVLANHAQNI